MSKCTTPQNPPQPAPPPAAPKPVLPKVSWRLLLVLGARRDAARHGVNPVPAMATAHRVYVATGGNRYAARRASFAVVDAQCGRGEVA